MKSSAIALNFIHSNTLYFQCMVKFTISLSFSPPLSPPPLPPPLSLPPSLPPLSLDEQPYLINLIDSPGHVDFSSEVRVHYHNNIIIIMLRLPLLDHTLMHATIISIICAIFIASSPGHSQATPNFSIHFQCA